MAKILVIKSDPLITSRLILVSSLSMCITSQLFTHRHIKAHLAGQVGPRAVIEPVFRQVGEEPHVGSYSPVEF